MIFEALSVKHLESLFRFESNNRAWFETQISSRGDDFYSELAIQGHIQDSIVDAQLGNSYSAVLVENGEISARANIRNICDKKSSASVGYRVAYNKIGQGRASYCLAELIRQAHASYEIQELTAQVLSNNPASISVLKKHGFKEIDFVENFIELNGEKLACATLSRRSN